MNLPHYAPNNPCGYVHAHIYLYNPLSVLHIINSIAPQVLCEWYGGSVHNRKIRAMALIYSSAVDGWLATPLYKYVSLAANPPYRGYDPTSSNCSFQGLGFCTNIQSS